MRPIFPLLFLVPGIALAQPGPGSSPIVTTTPKSGAFTTSTCTVGTSSGQCLASGAYNHVQVQNISSSASIACSWGGTAALNSTGVVLAAGQSALWGPATSGVPSGALNCIASAASTPLYVESN